MPRRPPGLQQEPERQHSAGPDRQAGRGRWGHTQPRCKAAPLRRVRSFLAAVQPRTPAPMHAPHARPHQLLLALRLRHQRLQRLQRSDGGATLAARRLHAPEQQLDKRSQRPRLTAAAEQGDETRVKDLLVQRQAGGPARRAYRTSGAQGSGATLAQVEANLVKPLPNPVLENMAYACSCANMARAAWHSQACPASPRPLTWQPPQRAAHSPHTLPAPPPPPPCTPASAGPSSGAAPPPVPAAGCPATHHAGHAGRERCWR